MKKKVFVFVNFLVLGMVIFLVASLLILCNFKNQVMIVENQAENQYANLYEELKNYESLLQESNIKISFVKAEDFQRLNQEKNWFKNIFSRKTELVGRIFLEKEIGNKKLEEKKEAERKAKNQFTYKIQEKR